MNRSLATIMQYIRKVNVPEQDVMDEWEKQLTSEGVAGWCLTGDFKQMHNPMKKIHENPVWRKMLVNYAFASQYGICRDCLIASNNIYTAKLLE